MALGTFYRKLGSGGLLGVLRVLCTMAVSQAYLCESLGLLYNNHRVSYSSDLPDTESSQAARSPGKLSSGNRAKWPFRLPCLDSIRHLASQVNFALGTSGPLVFAGAGGFFWPSSLHPASNLPGFHSPSGSSCYRFSFFFETETSLTQNDFSSSCS